MQIFEGAQQGASNLSAAMIQQEKDPPSMTQPEQPGATAHLGAAIPMEQALEIRRLAHDLSNALEIIIQTSYLVSTLEIDPDGRRWVEMLNSAVKNAVDLNGDLRSYIQANSRGTAG